MGRMSIFFLSQYETCGSFSENYLINSVTWNIKSGIITDILNQDKKEKERTRWERESDDFVSEKKKDRNCFQKGILKWA